MRTYHRGPRPNAWKYKHDKYKNDKHRAWSRAKAQAEYRGEGWNIPEELWMTTVWPDHLYDRRGRDSTDLCLTRIDPEKTWSPDNVFIATRRLHLSLQIKDSQRAEVEPGVWDLVGESLQRHLNGKAIADKYRYKYNNKKEK